MSIERRGIETSLWTHLATDAYHLLRNTSWLGLVGIFFTAYLALNLAFAFLLWVSSARVANAEGFLDLFFFSVQSMATIGYGGMMPEDLLAHTVVVLESFVGVVYTAVLTGVFFGKFSTPRARVVFSKTCVVAEEDGAPTLMFRCANERSTALIEASVRVALTRDELLPHGELARRIYDLSLRRDNSPLFALSWTVYHRIDERSPLYGRTREQIESEGTAIIITLTGIDDSLAATVHTRHIYDAKEILWGARFVDILGMGPDGKRYADFRRLHDTRPI